MTAPILVEYAARASSNPPRMWTTAIWVNGEVTRHVTGTPAHDSAESAIDCARDVAIDIASRYLGRGEVTIRARVEGPRPLTMESTVGRLAEALDADGASLRIAKHTVSDGWSWRCDREGKPALLGWGLTVAAALDGLCGQLNAEAP